MKHFLNLQDKKNKIIEDVKTIMKPSAEKAKKEILKMQQKTIIKLIEDWKDLMYQTGTYNQYYDTFTFDKIKYEKFGFRANLYCPKGLTFKLLENLRDKIEDGLHCIFIYNKERLDKYMEITIVTQLCTDKKFSPPKTMPYEICIGDRFDGSPIIIDLNKWCQVLISGTTGGGKSKLLDCILTTQIYNHSVKDLELYLIQLDKCDLVAYEDARITKGFANNLDKAVVMLEYILKEIDKRNKLVEIVKKKFKGSNITDYNKYNPKNKQPVILIAIDEMASIAEKSSDSPQVKAKKAMVDDMLSAIAQYGRSNNVFLISCLQRPTAVLLNTFIKSMSNLKISFRQSNQKSSEVAMDDSTIALDLAQRIAVYKQLSYDFLQTPYIDDPLIEKFISSKLQPNHMTIFDSLEVNKRLQEIKGNKKDTKQAENQETGKQDVSYELMLKLKEAELKKEKEEQLKREKAIDNKLKLLEAKENNVKEQRNLVKDDFDKVTYYLEKNEHYIKNWKEPPKTGKEVVK